MDNMRNYDTILGQKEEVRRPIKAEEEESWWEQHTVIVDIPKKEDWKPLTMQELLDAGIYY